MIREEPGFAGGLNFYAYADGNPISLIDPFGLGAQEAGWGSQFAGWIDRNVTSPLNSVSTTSTLLNYYAYNGGSVVGGFADMFRLGEGTANAIYNAQDGWDVAIGITQDVGRGAGLATLVGGGLEATVGRVGTSVTSAGSIALPTTGRATASIAEQMVMRSAAEGNGTVIMRGPFGDPAFQAPGWVKVQTVGRGTEGNISVHYMRNEITGATTQYKFVTEPYVGPTRAISL